MFLTAAETGVALRRRKGALLSAALLTAADQRRHPRSVAEGALPLAALPLAALLSAALLSADQRRHQGPKDRHAASRCA